MHPHTSPSRSPTPMRTIMVRSHHGRHGPRGPITVVTLLTLLGLAAMSGASGIRPQDASAHLFPEAFTLGNYGTATVDGVFADGEYGEGCFISPSQNVGGTTYHFTLCATNDDVTNYYAFLIDDLTPATTGPAGADEVNIQFDDEHNGALACPKAEDVIGVVSKAGSALIDGAYCGAFEFFSLDSSTHGSAAMTFSPDVGYVYEMMHPLDSGDPADYALALHDMVGFCVAYIDASNAAGGVQFPKNCQGDGERYGDVFQMGEFDDQLAKLKTLVDSCEPCPPAVRRPLEEDIDQAIRQYTRNDEAATAQTLHGFVTTVERSLQAGTLPESVGRQLTAVATPLIAELGAAKAPAKDEARTKAEKETKAEARTTHSRDAAHNGKEKRGKQKQADRHRRDR
jgi:hypothetical protein